MRDKKDYLFSAGEIGQFTFCSVSWFLKRQGYHTPPSKNKSHGLIVHDSLGKKTHQFTLFFRLGYYLIILGVIVMSAILILRFFEVAGW